MKASDKYESIASTMALAGVLMFGFALYPILNPIQWKIDLGSGYILAHLLSLPVSLYVMWKAMCLTKRAQQLKREEAAPSRSDVEE